MTQFETFTFHNFKIRAEQAERALNLITQGGALTLTTKGHMRILQSAGFMRANEWAITKVLNYLYALDVLPNSPETVEIQELRSYLKAVEYGKQDREDARKERVQDSVQSFVSHLHLYRDEYPSIVALIKIMDRTPSIDMPWKEVAVEMRKENPLLPEDYNGRQASASIRGFESTLTPALFPALGINVINLKGNLVAETLPNFSAEWLEEGYEDPLLGFLG